MAGQQYVPQSGNPPHYGVAGGPAGRGGRGGLQYVLYALVLVGVAVVAGLVWWGVRPSGAPPVGEGQEPTVSNDDPLTSGDYRYTRVAGPAKAGDCAANSYGRVADWFEDHPCTAVARALFTTEVDGARALVSVVRVTMPSDNEAGQLSVVTDTDGTGNVNDLQRDGTATLPGAPSVARGEYHSEVVGPNVTIIEAAFFDDHSDDALLQRIAKDAVRLSTTLR